MTMTDTMAQQALELGQAAFDAFNARDSTRLRGMLAENFVLEQTPNDHLESAEAFIASMDGGWLRALPDLRSTVQRSIASGDTAMLELIWEGTHTGHWNNLAAPLSRRAASRSARWQQWPCGCRTGS
jgi:ketosteroid isomerase-like protein